MTRAVLQSKPTLECAVLYVAFELSNSRWKLALSAGGTRVTEQTVEAGDIKTVQAKVAAAKEKRGLPADASVVSCYEAGRDGFWIHRVLEELGFHNVVVDPSSIEVDRRKRRAKTDRLDVHKLLGLLKRYWAGNHDCWRVVRVPTIEEEDARRPQRERERLKKERAAHSNRIRSLLVLHGIRCSVGPSFVEYLDTLTLPGGQPLPAHLKAELKREWARWELADQQIKELGRDRRARVRAEDSSSELVVKQVKQLTQLVGIGPETAWTLAGEFFAWREFRNRRELAALAGLTPTPYASGDSARDQGISKAGNRRVRSVLIEIAWGWLRFQPESKLTLWFQQRFGHGSGRMRRIGIVAVARRLLIALWSFVKDGVVPEGARLQSGC